MRVRAQYDGYAKLIVPHDHNRVLKEIEMRGTKEFDMDAGDGNAKVGITHGFKKWESSRDGGLTVEATVSVTLTCNQDEKTINLAADKASDLSEHQAQKGLNRMMEYLRGL